MQGHSYLLDFAIFLSSRFVCILVFRFALSSLPLQRQLSIRAIIYTEVVVLKICKIEVLQINSVFILLQRPCNGALKPVQALVLPFFVSCAGTASLPENNTCILWCY